MIQLTLCWDKFTQKENETYSWGFEGKRLESKQNSKSETTTASHYRPQL